MDECKSLPRSGKRSASWSARAARTLNQGLTLVPISTQLEVILPRSAQLKLTLFPP